MDQKENIKKIDLSLNGQITVFLSLSLLIICALLTAVIESARVSAMRMRIENACDMGMQSIFAEYNRELLEQYDLYFIDTSYGGSKGDAFYTGEHLKEYMEYNLNPSKGQVVLKGKDFCRLSPENVDISVYSLATDDNCAVFKRQAIHAIKDQYGISIVEQAVKNQNDYQNSGIDSFDVVGEREKNVQRIRKKNTESEENPADKIEKERAGILNLILGELEVSEKSSSLGQFASNRTLKTGNGIIENSEDLNSVTNEFLFGEYIAKKFSNYVNQMNHEEISYEMEYILKGKSSDVENLKAVVKDLLLFREGANVLSLLSDQTKMAEAEGVAAVASIVILSPELMEAIQYAIIFAWGFAEAAVDVHTLLVGGKVPIMKSEAEWILPLSKAWNFKAHLNDGMRVTKGLTYNSYLKLFLSMENADNKIYRCLDAIEMNLRHTKGNHDFSMDFCLEYLEAETSVISRFGYEYKIRRFFGYEAMPQQTY